MPRPAAAEYPSHFAGYVEKVKPDQLHEAIDTYAASLNEFYTGLPEDKADYRYAEGKWTVKEVLQHVIDAERVFSYRVMCIARRDKTSLPSFDENNYAEYSHADRRSLADLKEEFVAVRRSTDHLLRSLDEAQLSEQGLTNGKPATAKSIAYVIFGHLLHHQQILEERYL